MRRRLSELLGVAEAQADAGPLVTERWLLGRRAALDGLDRELAGRAALADQAQEERARAAENVGAAGERLREIEGRLVLYQSGQPYRAEPGR